jgi:HNH endonuclease
MSFKEATKLEAKRRAHFSCIVCHQPFVEVHHIIPQADGGSDDLENAAPLCASCHDLLGGNPDKRKQIREMRDLWYELCETRFRDSPSLKLAEAVEDIKSHQYEQGATLSGIKKLLEDYYSQQSREIAAASTAQQVASLSGVAITQQVMIKCPKTKRSIFTGIVMPEATFRSSIFENNSVSCPHCGRQHVWSKEDAFVEDS